MSIFKCKMCGGTIEFEPGAMVGVCDSCGTKQTLPRLDDDKKANLYDRANHFRRNNDFDKATGIYEQILNEDKTDAEAYWSLVLCRYGIEYVEDPATHKRVPTVNRAQYTSVFDDEDYKAAIQYADTTQQEIYESEAKAINEIQKGILEISQKEEPFDVFICYKETDANGRRTPDSVLATDLYHQLTQEGFKVFFSRITLEDKLGIAYEPYIFAALNSAKVMVVLGTKPTHFNAVWVKNEWSRYLALIRGGAKKVLIPAYRDMDPYDLPEEFSHLQAQDMSKLGFMQDLIRGIKKLAEADKPAAKETVVQSSAANVTPLLKRAFLFLEDGDWNSANAYCEKVLDQEPENAQAYLGKLMAELQVRRQDDLKDCEQSFATSNNYQKAVRFGDDALREALRDDITHIEQRNEETRLAKAYTEAKAAMDAASCEEDYKKAADVFGDILQYRDASKLHQQCLETAKAIRKDKIYDQATLAARTETSASQEEAVRLLSEIPGWRDADAYRDRCTAHAEELKAEEALQKEEERLEEERKAFEREKATELRKRRVKRVSAISAIAITIIVAITLLFTQIILPISAYKKAEMYLAKGDYEAAYLLLDGLTYKDSSTKLAEIKPQYAKILLSKAAVGSTVIFGSYEQDNNTSNGKEDIEWQVLAKDGNKILVISKYALDCQEYNSEYTSITWENCSLRKWLNGTFLNNAFSSEEQSLILTINVSVDTNPSYSTSPGNATNDKIFLLSITEVTKYFSSDEVRKCAPTAYAIANGVRTSDSYKSASGEATCWWWLRSPGYLHLLAAYVRDVGAVRYYGNEVSYDDVAVRPALWISLE